MIILSRGDVIQTDIKMCLVDLSDNFSHKWMFIRRIFLLEPCRVLSNRLY